MINKINVAHIKYVYDKSTRVRKFIPREIRTPC
ncbi:MAG: hypothetical protein ACI915_003688 [Gammaproteobacteria bacterium]|jgi:hypothetical protein